MAPGIFAGPSAAHSGKPSGREEDYEFTDAKHAGSARAWAAGGKEVPQASIGTVSGSGISVNRDEKLRDGYDSPGVVTNDATSEEWIMKEDSSR
ncbi:uncharacterized protein J4E79_002253 [Alternaria viburni]|uniref:uncharacterized protein n=1 Tax=Alternaria viburni TaxID=566460 RepID=UPI0020C428DB|nr:uncharacterized protein J4E79_002253 [Alternaria viburni]KAI4667564.1 hypothetical protein J4E79_002253 [Alternaria viburni]